MRDRRSVSYVRHLALVTLLLVAALPLRGRAAAPMVHVLVRFRGGIDAAARGELARHGGILRREIVLARDGVAATVVPEDQLASLRAEPGVAYVEEDAWRRPALLAKSELVPALSNGLYGLVLTRATQAQARRVTGAGVAVCVVDQGVDLHHPDLVDVVRGGVDEVDHDDDPDTDTDATLGFHGTFVDGIIAASLNKKGVRGVAYGATIYHGRALGADGGRVSDILAAAQELVEAYGCRILNLSLGGSTYSQTEADFYRDLIADHDVLVVAAAGNDGDAPVLYPAAYPGVVAVGAVDRNASHAAFSDTGDAIALSAPGVSILSSVPRGSGSETSLTVHRHPFRNLPMTFGGLTSARGLARKRVVDCGTGNTPGEFPRSVRGAIALMERGDLFFSDKVTNAMNAGAVAAIIYNNIGGDLQGTLQTPTTADGRRWIPALGITAVDGASLLRPHVLATLLDTASSWGSGDGTSFAAPHVAGAAALVWSVAPELDHTQVLELLEQTAVDLGDPGRDPVYGFGLIDVDAATRAAAALR